MKKRLLALLLLVPFSAIADRAEWHYNQSGKMLDLTVSETVSTTEVMSVLADDMDFELILNGHESVIQPAHYSGRFEDVIRRLLAPASVVLSMNGDAPPVVRFVSVLPVGEGQGALPTNRINAAERAFETGSYRGPEHNREKFRRRLSQ